MRYVCSFSPTATSVFSIFDNFCILSPVNTKGAIELGCTCNLLASLSMKFLETSFCPVSIIEIKTVDTFKARARSSCVRSPSLLICFNKSGKLYIVKERLLHDIDHDTNNLADYL